MGNENKQGVELAREKHAAACRREAQRANVLVAVIVVLEGVLPDLLAWSFGGINFFHFFSSDAFLLSVAARSSPLLSSHFPRFAAGEVGKSSHMARRDGSASGESFSPALAIDLVSGAGAGLISSILCAPLDVAKVRLQVQGSLGLKKYKGGVVATISKIYREEGIRGPFKGIGPALITAPLFWGVYWPLYGHLKPVFAESFPESSSYVVHLLAAISAGGVADVITNPFWVTRTRIQTLFLHSEEKLSDRVGTWVMMRRIFEQEGFLAFYRGLAASLLGLSHVAIQFPLCKHCLSSALGELSLHADNSPLVSR